MSLAPTDPIDDVRVLNEAFELIATCADCYFNSPPHNQAPGGTRKTELERVLDWRDWFADELAVALRRLADPGAPKLREGRVLSRESAAAALRLIHRR
ncbi:MAG: hypothetical protein QM704_24115 [Anaeromyxobacteraceae bacterium]